MKNRTFFIAVLAAAAVMFTGCANSGMFISTNRTNVDLASANYQVAAANVTGEAHAGYVFGVSYSLGAQAGAMAIARITGSGKLYQEALENLWKNYEAKYGAVEGKKLALANVRFDSDILNLLLYSQVKISVRADVIEFSE